MKIVSAPVLMCALLVAAQAPTVGAPQRQGIALLIGNINYPEDPLAAVAEDLRGMQPALEALGFETDVVTDLDRPDDFRAAVRRFLRKATASDIVLVLYSGHGMQLEGTTYLLGKNYRTVTEPQAAAFGHAFSADELLRELEQAPPYARIVIIDACRINAFSAQDERGGIALRQNYDNTIVLFSNEPGKTVPARSEASLRSPFIEALIYALTTASHGIKEIFEIARKATLELSPTQLPQMITSLNFDSDLLAVKTPRTPSRRAAELVNQARTLYADHSWQQYREVFQTARAVAAEPALVVRIDRELLWVTHVVNAESAADKNDYAAEAAQWDAASGLFPARVWTAERAAIARLKADRPADAIPLLLRLSLASDDVVASRARRMLASLVTSDPQLNEIAKKSHADGAVQAGPEFEPVEIPH